MTDPSQSSPEALECPQCGQTHRQVKAGLAEGRQRYKCMSCGRRYSTGGRPKAYSPSLRERARTLRASGATLRRIAHEVGVSPQTVANWFQTESPSPTTGQENAGSEPAQRQRVTIADVARHAGVSTSTVSNYLNDTGRMGAKTRQRIEAAMKALYFTPNALVRAIRGGRTYTLGLLSFGIDDLQVNVEYSVAAPLLGAITRAADDATYDVLVYTGWPHRTRARAGSDFLNGQIDGLLWVAAPPNDPQLLFVAEAGLPVVTLLASHVPEGVGYVVAENAGGLREMVGYLAGLGHRRIGYLGSSETSDFLDRAVGYREGLAAEGIAHDPRIQAVIVPPWSLADVSAAIDPWLARPDRPTAIVAADDEMAERVIEALTERKIRVPDDMSVAGFNDLPAAATMRGGLTTIRQPLVEIGRLGVERLVAMIEGAPAAECRVTMPVRLIPRASTCPPRRPA